jgi:hypothetical protein
MLSTEQNFKLGTELKKWVELANTGQLTNS